ncbi:hypothetical protein [Fulvivirga sp.]|uniref:hypothetical protein n=1 Tax=Fulvivirga sp. TaxID=1931237 RepID=UPI0032EFCF69
MRIIDIFVEENSNLYTVQYDFDERDSLTIAYDKLTDTAELREFFKQFKPDFEKFYGKQNLNKVVLQTIDEADRLFNVLLELADNDSETSLNELFKPLDNNEAEDSSYDFQQLKAYSDNPGWIRLYAVRYGESYVFTGGTIKLTQRMKDRKHTKFELDKLQKVSEYLAERGEEGQIGYIDIQQ